MLKRRNRGSRYIGTLLLTLLFAVAAYAFTASNTVPTSKAGDGSGAISGYSVSSVVYTLDAADPTMIQKVAFTLDAAATSVQASLTGAAPFQSCVVAGLNVTCTFATEPTVLSVTNLREIAVQ
jgi:hypothetical protein